MCYFLIFSISYLSKDRLLVLNKSYQHNKYKLFLYNNTVIRTLFVLTLIKAYENY